MSIFDFFRKTTSPKPPPPEKTEFQRLLAMDEDEFREYQKGTIEEFNKDDYLGCAATAKHNAESALKAKQYDRAWKLFHEQKLNYMKHAARSAFTKLQTLARDSSVSEDLANILRLEGKHHGCVGSGHILGCGIVS